MTESPADKLVSQVTEDERAELESCSYQVTPARSLTVNELAVAWAAHVRKIDSDRSGSADDPRTWGPDDLVAALYIRDFLADCIDRLSAGLAGKVVAVIEQYDELFRAVTQPDDSRLVARVAERDLAGRPWWWHRIPDSGPMLDELRAFG